MSRGVFGKSAKRPSRKRRGTQRERADEESRNWSEAKFRKAFPSALPVKVAAGASSASLQTFQIRSNWAFIAPTLLAIITLMPGCVRGSRSEKPPIHLVPDMDSQGKYDAQGEGAFFADHMAMRKPVAGTLAQGKLRDDPLFYAGKDESGNFVVTAPLALTVADIERGQERYNIYCTPCHGMMGDGNGAVPKKGFPPPPSFHNDRARAFADGYIYDKITNGSAIMTSYAAQIPVKDRWAIVAYIRALQLSQHAPAEELPAGMVEGKP